MTPQSDQVAGCDGEKAPALEQVTAKIEKMWLRPTDAVALGQ
jgi:hypothetical protein